MTFEDFKIKYQSAPVKHYPDRLPDIVFVSVCVMAYNHEKYIKECLDGILSQVTNFNFEILLGEDASSDKTRDICIEYAEAYPQKIRLFLHCRENNIKYFGNPSGKFNFLYNLFKSRGKYIALCEGDDYWTDSTKLQRQVDILESNEKAAMCTHETNHLYYPLDRNRSLSRMMSIIYFDTQLYGAGRLLELSILLILNRKEFWRQDRSHLNKKRKERLDLKDMSDGTWFMSFCSIMMHRKIIDPVPDCLPETDGAHQTLLLLGAMNGGIIHLKEAMAVKRDQETSISRNAERKKRIEIRNRLPGNHNKILRYKCLQKYATSSQRVIFEEMIKNLTDKIEKDQLSHS